VTNRALRARRPSGIAAIIKVMTVLLWSVISIAGCSSGNPEETTVVADPPAITDHAPYQIGCDDVIDVLVWKQPQLTARVRVASDGTITMPLINQVAAAGKTTSQMQQTLTVKFAKFVRDPTVTVRIYDPASRVFYALGEVVKPGRYPLMSGEVLSQALAAAGGPTEYANLRKIRIVRRSREGQTEFTVNYRAILKGDLSADVPLERADTIMVP
jgi:polysaccharide export outer membrane protein